MYLKDSKDLSYHEIAVLLNRNDRTIWTCYNRGKKKIQANPEKESTKSKPDAEKTDIETDVDKEIAIPLEMIKNRLLAPLEAISEFLKDEKDMSYHEIAALLNRDDRTIWTCYKRAKNKRGDLS